jgi:hypothetical protein
VVQLAVKQKITAENEVSTDECKRQHSKTQFSTSVLRTADTIMEHSNEMTAATPSF